MSATRADFSGWPRGPTLTFHSAESLIDPLCPDANYSPESSYSAISPEFQSPTTSTHQAFEFDNSHEEIHAEEYDEMQDQLAEEGIMEGEGEMWNRPGWGNLRNYGTTSGGRRPSWALSNAGGSIISISPRGSLSSLGGGSLAGSVDSRRGSIPKAPKLPYEARRRSNPSLLGFDLAEQRRRSSIAKDLLRRRSSALSFRSNSFSAPGQPTRAGSTVGMGIRVFDSVEETRLRNIASLELLKRRFSEVVEVNHMESDEEEDLEDAWAYQGAWSPYTGSYYSENEYDEDEDDSEIHTESYVPSPEFRNGSLFVPSSYSNFPLESVALAPIALRNDSQSDLSSINPSPLLQASRFTQTATAQLLGTPPAPSQPNAILRDSFRPSFHRAETAFVVPSSMGVPPGATPPRPGLGRSVSNPLITTSLASKEAVKAIEIRAQGSFPLARATPLGVSPLRESLRRQSVVSEGEASRRTSMAERRRSSVAPATGPRRDTRTASENDFMRRSSLAERRMSLVKESALRRMSGDTRRSSKGTSSDSRKSSGTAPLSGARQPSSGELRRSSSLKELDTNTRQSSVVSIGEYGYLAPQIVIDTPKITAPSQPTPETSSQVPLKEPKAAMAEVPKFRSNAPPSIILPSYSFPSSSGLATSSTISPICLSPSDATPRYNPLSYFVHNPSPTESGSPYDPLVTPTATKDFFPYTTTTPKMNQNQSPKTPKFVNVIDRGRPIASPEFNSSILPFKEIQPPSPKSSCSVSVPSTSTSSSPSLISDDHGHPTGEKEVDTVQEKSLGEVARIKSLDKNVKKTISIEDMHLVLANVNEKERSVEIVDINNDNNEVESGRPERSLTSKVPRPSFLRGTSVPVFTNHKSNYTFPSNNKSTHNSSSFPISSSTPSSPLGPGQKSSHNESSSSTYQFPSQDKGKGKGKSHLLSPQQPPPALVKRRSITFIEPPSPRGSRPKIGDRTSSFTRFLQSSIGISKAKLSNNNSSSQTSSSSSSSSSSSNSGSSLSFSKRT